MPCTHYRGDPSIFYTVKQNKFDRTKGNKLLDPQKFCQWELFQGSLHRVYIIVHFFIASIVLDVLGTLTCFEWNDKWRLMFIIDVTDKYLMKFFHLYLFQERCIESHLEILVPSAQVWARNYDLSDVGNILAKCKGTTSIHYLLL